MHEDKRKPTICIIIRMFLLCMSFVNFQERNNSMGLKYGKRLEIGDHLIQNLIISLLPGQNDYNDPNESISPHVDKKSLKLPEGKSESVT